jgi:hypothetical protein
MVSLSTTKQNTLIFLIPSSPGLARDPGIGGSSRGGVHLY